MNDIDALSLLSAAFSKSDQQLRFASKDIASIKSYVAWIDIMGSGFSMRRSLPEASAKIGKFNAALFTALYASARENEVSVHSMTDGAYVLSKSPEELRTVLSLIMLQLARSFLEASRNNKFVVRVSVAHGDVVTSQEMDKRLRNNPKIKKVDKALLRNVMLGGPFSIAYESEGCAPPFGVFVDKSAIGEDMFSVGNIWEWWSPTTSERDDFIIAFRRCLLRYFERVENHYYDFMLSAAKIAEYKSRIRSYFKTESKEKEQALDMMSNDWNDDGESSSDDSSFD